MKSDTYIILLPNGMVVTKDGRRTFTELSDKEEYIYSYEERQKIPDIYEPYVRPYDFIVKF